MIGLSTPDGILHGERADVHQKPPSVYSAGRVCEAPGCGTVLSIYNESTTCSLHGHLEEMHRVYRVHRARGTRPHSVAA